MTVIAREAVRNQTMVALGYGDIAPVSPASRLCVILQAVGGQMYLAVLAARLVGLHIARSVGRENGGH